MPALANAITFVRQMGARYVLFRVYWEVARRSGWLRRQFPTKPSPAKNLPTLAEWRTSGNVLQALRPAAPASAELPALAEAAARLHSGAVPIFNGPWLGLGSTWNYRTHPITGYVYPLRHWTEIADFSAQAGDIKYVWEKARFSWVYTLLRYELAGGPSQADYIFGQIDGFIAANPPNLGPQSRCSQEISLRCLNWLAVLEFYRQDAALTEARFASILQAIAWQMAHVRSAIHFSRIAVRNNHALTETLALALVGRLLPTLPGAEEYAKSGQKWFEEEVAYQVFADGAYIQHSHNYARIVAQLLTLALDAGPRLGITWAPVVAERARALHDFLAAHQEAAYGTLPNYGHNDGALFFPLTGGDYRDYRWVLSGLVFRDSGHRISHDYIVSGGHQVSSTGITNHESRITLFSSGYAIARQGPASLTTLRCGRYHTRPAQADGLHVDVFWQGQNLLRDAGSYRYNTDHATLMQFIGTAAHNTCTLAGQDQMRKGPRFIWYGWSQAQFLTTSDFGDWMELRGQMLAWLHVLPGGALHTRTVRVHKRDPRWLITDEIVAAKVGAQLPGPIQQHWHPHPDFAERLHIVSRGTDGALLTPHHADGWYSTTYGQREVAPHLWFEGFGRIETEIWLDE